MMENDYICVPRWVVGLLVVIAMSIVWALVSELCRACWEGRAKKDA